jgi:hypothetical protein
VLCDAQVLASHDTMLLQQLGALQELFGYDLVITSIIHTQRLSQAFFDSRRHSGRLRACISA